VREHRDEGTASGEHRRSPRRSQVPERGQAAVEFALVLPLVIVLLLVLVQVGLVVRDQILVVHAAREGAREAAVDPAPDAARRAAEAASGLDRSRLEVNVSGRGAPGSRVRVEASYRAPTDVPVVGAAVGDLRLEASATMRVER
jgi:Flp pilus assembly protein TadG